MLLKAEAPLGPLKEACHLFLLVGRPHRIQRREHGKETKVGADLVAAIGRTHHLDRVELVAARLVEEAVRPAVEPLLAGDEGVGTGDVRVPVLLRVGLPAQPGVLPRTVEVDATVNLVDDAQVSHDKAVLVLCAAHQSFVELHLPELGVLQTTLQGHGAHTDHVWALLLVVHEIVGEEEEAVGGAPPKGDGLDVLGRVGGEDGDGGLGAGLEARGRLRDVVARAPRRAQDALDRVVVEALQREELGPPRAHQPAQRLQPRRALPRLHGQVDREQLHGVTLAARLEEGPISASRSKWSLSPSCSLA